MSRLANSSHDGIADYGNTVVTGKELANVLGLSEAHVFTLKRKNVIQPIRPRKSENRLGESIRAYIQYKCGQDSAAVADYHLERAKKEAANRQLREILVQQTRAQLHRACDVEAIQADSNADIRCRISKFGNQLSLQIAGKTDPAEIKTLIDTAVRKVLNELRQYDARDYYRRSKTRKLDQKQSPRGRGWLKGRPRPEASESNRARWQRDPEALARTVRAMNAAKSAAPDKVRSKLSRAAKKRWQRIPVEQKSAHMAKMRAARGGDFAKRALETRRQNRARASGAGDN
jgi:hypothetical protein